MIETIILWICLALAGAGLLLALRADAPFIRGPVRRVQAKIVRHHLLRDDGATMYSPVFRFPDERGQLIEVRDRVYTPFPTPVIGESVEIVHPSGHPEKARIPYPVFRGLMYAALVYALVMLGAEITGWW